MLQWLADAFRSEHLVLAGQLGLAALLGGLIGLERERKSRAAGLRTHMIVCLGACLITLISVQVGQTYGGDRARIAAQIVSGIGFLGAGAIMRHGSSVRGLTTAAVLWTSAGVGMAVGTGFYMGAAVATAMTLIATFIFGKLERRIIEERVERMFIVDASDAPGVIDRVHDVLRQHGIQVRQVGLEKDNVTRKQRIEIRASVGEACDLEAVVRQLGEAPEVDKVDLEST